MNNGLLGWPQGLSLPKTHLLGPPTLNKDYRYRPIPAFDDAVGSAVTGVGTTATIPLATNLALEDLLIVGLRTSDSASPTLPATWTAIHGPGTNTGGYLWMYKFAEAADVTNGTVDVTTAGSGVLVGALAYRIPGAGVPILGTAQTGTGSTPIMNGVIVATAGIPFLGASLSTSENARANSDWVNPVSGVNTLVWSDHLTQISNNDRVSAAWITNQQVGTGFNNWQSGGSWTTFTQIGILIPPLRARGAIYR